MQNATMPQTLHSARRLTRTLAVVGLVLLIAALTACGGGDPEDQDGPTAQPVNCTTGACK